MRVIRYVQFDEREQVTLERALEGHEHDLELPPRRAGEDAYYPARAFLSRIRRGEAFDTEALLDLDQVLAALSARWEPFRTAEAWRKIGAPGGDEAVEGLAAGSVAAVERATAARRVVRRGISKTRRHVAAAAAA